MKDLLIIICILILSHFTICQNLDKDTKPLVCDWEHINGVSGWNCYNNKFYTEDDGMALDFTKGNYTSIWRMVPEDNKNKHGYPIELKSVKRLIYDKINWFRLVHKVSSLYEDEKLEKSAQERAQQMAAKNTKKVYPKDQKNRKESVYCSGKDNIIDSVLKWYNQRYKYYFGNTEKNKNRKEVRDFVNMVWKKTYSVGCGIANNYENYFIACHYSPHLSGKFKDNIFKANRLYDSNNLTSI
ncbi:CAP domain-containing protein [Strongyloides ratti]|uniref:CAP domain-containing protein n=1 Tax=Strongyloides ratti TaxID=34506 RepID=A0A090LP14_STRRB|nr:CAP domain-containing protein [Strongyloides ratti]CEF69929.1 CAP domain-containing protein [Strongyloides ratti]